MWPTWNLRLPSDFLLSVAFFKTLWPSLPLAVQEIDSECQEIDDAATKAACTSPVRAVKPRTKILGCLGEFFGKLGLADSWVMFCHCQYLDDTLQKDALSRPQFLQSLLPLVFLDSLPFSFEFVQPGGVYRFSLQK